LPNHIAPKIIKQRARELRALGETKSASFHHSQAGRTLSVLTLHHPDRRSASSASGIPDSTDWTPALSCNYLKLRISGNWLPNRFMDVVCSADQQTLATPELQPAEPILL